MSGDVRLKTWFFLICIGLGLAAVYSFWVAFKAWSRSRVIEDTPTSKVRSAAQGYVELSGHGMLPPNAENRAPLTGKPCTWWRYKIEERRYAGRSRSWTTIQNDTSAIPFLLDDGTGQCLIDPRGAEVFPGASNVWYGPSEWPQVCIPSGSGIFGRLVDALVTDKYRYTEHRLQAREQVYAIGAFRSLGGVSIENPDDQVAAVLRDWKQDQGALLARFDSNHDGTISREEWDLARAAARKQVLDGRDAQTQQPGVGVLADPADGRSFLLAASDGESLARRFRLRALTGLLVFVASTATLAWMLWSV
ncbi:MAG TPA: GIDE domain-containing protein [Steroidobacteraceae bacterium]